MMGTENSSQTYVLYHLDYQHKHIKGDLFQHTWWSRWQTVWGVRFLQQTIFTAVFSGTMLMS